MYFLVNASTPKPVDITTIDCIIDLCAFLSPLDFFKISYSEKFVRESHKSVNCFDPG